MGRRAQIMWEEKEEKLTTKEQVLAMAGKSGADCVVVGLHGRKGPKM